MNRNQIVAIAVIVGFGVTLLYFSLPPVDNTTHVKIGYLSQDLHQLALRVAVEKGWFAEQNLTADLFQYANGGYEMDGFLAGQIDMGYLGAAPALTKSINQGVNITVLAAANLEGSALMVYKEEFDAGHITEMADLAGKTVFTPGSSTVQNFLLRLALNQSGMTVDDVQLENTAPQNMAISLTTDKPAFIAWEPFNALAEYNGQAVPLWQSGEIWPRHPCCVLAVSNSYLESNPAVVESVVRIHQMAEEWIVEHPAEALAIAVGWLGINSTPVETAFNRITYDYNVNRTGLQIYLEFLIAEDLVEMDVSDIDTFLDAFINTDFIES